MPDSTERFHRRSLLDAPETLLPADFIDVEISARIEEGEDTEALAREHPESPLIWAVLAQDALADGQEVAAYAYARTGYHRGLDALRRAGWRGHGAIPASHPANRGFLRALAMLGETSRRIGDEAEYARVHDFLAEADPSLLG